MKYYTSTTEYNCGIDLHAHQMYVCLMDRQGRLLLHTNIRNNDFAFFLKRVEPYRHDLTVCAECMFGWYWLADACQAAGLTFVLALAQGLDPVEDRLPRRFFTEPLPESGKVLTEKQMDQLLQQYYRARGWDERGVPPA